MDAMNEGAGWQSLLLEYPEPGLAVVTLNRPSRANAINKTMLEELARVGEVLEADAAVRAVIVTGAGAAFSSGFDLKEQAMNTPKGVAQWEPPLEADFKGIMTFWHLSKPSIAAVNGAAMAGAFELVMGCDLAIASDAALFGEPEQKFGAGIVAMLLPWNVSPKIAKQVIFTGEDEISPAQALQWGLINEVVAPEALMERALKLGRKLARMDPMVMRRTKLAINRTYEIMGMQSALRNALEIDMLIEGEGSALKAGFLEVLRAQGMREALAWRNERLEGQQPLAE